MIRTQNLTPEIYYRESRDFQFLGRTYDIIFNYIKTNADLMENFPINRNTDSKLIELLCRTLGFENKTDYRNDDLNAICSIFIKLIRQKGSLASIHTLTKTILNVEGINKEYSIYQDENKVIKILIPDIITNPEIKLFEDVLEYILPIGVRYNIQKINVSKIDKPQELTIQTAASLNTFSNKSNNEIARDNSKIKTTKKSESGDFNVKTHTDPTKGDFRYSQVIDNKKEG
jgi:hypothetical protein